MSHSSDIKIQRLLCSSEEMSFQGFQFFYEKILSNLFDCDFLFVFLELGPQNVQTFFTVG